MSRGRAAGTIFGSAHAGSGYLKDSAADIVRNGYGECWHTGFWQPEDAVVGCDGMKMREPEKKMTKTQRLDRIVLDAETYFAFDKAELKPGAVDKLDALLESIRSSEGIERILVSGHADRIGPEEYNKRFSQRRAEAVEAYLRERVGTAALIETVGKGESTPIVTCPNETGSKLIACLAPNRWGEIDAEIKVISQ